MYPNGSACYGGNIEHAGLSLAREWETGTMEQLIATPVSAPELIIGKLAPYFCIGVLDLILCICVGQFVFNVPHQNVFILRGIYLKDVGLMVFWPEVLFLGGFGVIVMAVAVKKFKKKIG